MTPIVSVVLASGHGNPARALQQLRTCGERLPIECVRVTPDGRTPADVPEKHSCVQVRSAPDDLVPTQWGLGALAAGGSVIAFTTTDMIVDASWATSLLSAIRGGASGAAGEIRIAGTAQLGVRAVYLLRYSAYAPPITPGPVTDIPADNAAYSRAVLNLVPNLAAGFWEAELHRSLPLDAGPLVLVEGAGATLVSAPGPLVFMRQRFRHGVRFGAFRVTSGESALAILAKSPLVPVVLLARIARRCAARPGLRRMFVASLPLLLGFVATWALGEAVGAWQAKSKRRVRA